MHVNTGIRVASIQGEKAGRLSGFIQLLRKNFLQQLVLSRGSMS